MIGSHLNPEKLNTEIKQIEKQTLEENFWDDSQKAQEIMADLSDKKENFKTFTSFEEEIKDQSDLFPHSIEWTYHSLRQLLRDMQDAPYYC